MDSSTARKLWFGFAIIVTYGSIYPGNFQMQSLDSATIQAFLRSCCGTPHSGDVLGNFILFVPFGFFGMLAADRAATSMQRFTYVCILGVLLAFVLQLVQIYLPSRNENLQDVIWNFIGIVGGSLFGLSVRNFLSQSPRISQKILLVPWILIGTWLVYRLIPFVPSIDIQGIKDSLRPLVLHPELITKNILHDAVAWSLVAYFLRHGRRGISLDIYLPLLMLVTFCLEILIVTNSVSASNIVGAILATILWWGVLKRINRCEYVLALMLFCMLVFVGLTPFTLHFTTTTFNWLPFQGFLGGSMYINAQSACEKSFLYGSLVYLLWKGGCGVLSSTIMATLGVAMIEFAQTRFVGEHVPEITDPILVVLMALTLFAFKTNEITLQEETPLGDTQKQKSNVQAPVSIPEPKSDVISTHAYKHFVNQYIDLRSDQIEFVSNLAIRMEISSSRVIRHIIDDVMQDEKQPNVLGAPSPSESIQTEDEFIAYNIRLKKEQIAWLTQGVETNLSPSIRNLIDQFITNIGEDA